MRTVFAHCGTSDARHSKAKAFRTVSDARAFAQSLDPDNLNYVVITIHLAKEDLGNAAWSALINETLAVEILSEEGVRHAQT